MKRYRLTPKGRQAVKKISKRLITWLALVLLGLILAIVGITMLNEAGEQNARATQSEIQK